MSLVNLLKNFLNQIKGLRIQPLSIKTKPTVQSRLRASLRALDNSAVRGTATRQGKKGHFGCVFLCRATIGPSRLATQAVRRIGDVPPPPHL